MSEKSTRKAKKELTPKQQKIRIAGNWIINILCFVIIVFSLVVAVFTIVRSTNKDGVTDFFGKVYLSVVSDSMSPTFDKNDVIIGEAYEGDGSDLKVGQVVTFWVKNGNVQYLNTHRIVEKNGNVIRTEGDKYNTDYNPNWTEGNKLDAFRNGSDVVATWGSVDENGEFHNGKIMKGIGAFGNWLQDEEQGKIRFFCVIILPLILLFIAYAFVLIRTLVINKIDKEQKALAVQAATAPVTVDSLSDEEKRRLAEEYLATLNNGSQPESGTAQDGGSDANPVSNIEETKDSGNGADEGADE